MNEIMVWEPIGQDFIATCSCGSPDCYQTISVDLDGGLLVIEDEVNDKRLEFTLPAHLRLCRSISWQSEAIDPSIVNTVYDGLRQATIDYHDAWLAHEQLKDRLKILFDEEVTTGEVSGKNDYERRHNHRAAHADAYGDLFQHERDLSVTTRELQLAKVEVERLKIIMKLQEGANGNSIQE